MSRKRRTTYGGVSERAVALFRHGLQLERECKTETDLFKKVDLELSRELGLKPWHPSVYEVTVGLDEDDDGIPPNVPRDHRTHYQHVINLRRTLVGAPR